jgi:hypothetical protein
MLFFVFTLNFYHILLYNGSWPVNFLLSCRFSSERYVHVFSVVELLQVWQTRKLYHWWGATH